MYLYHFLGIKIGTSCKKSTEILIYLQYVVRVCDARSDLNQKIMLTILYAVLFPFEGCSPQVELYEISHYPALKERHC